MFLVLLDHPETIREPFGPEIPRIAINVRHVERHRSTSRAKSRCTREETNATRRDCVLKSIPSVTISCYSPGLHAGTH